MKRIITASIIAPLVVPLALLIAGRFSSSAVFVSGLAMIFTAGLTWIVGVPLSLVLARSGKERWWISILVGALLGIATVLSLAGRLPEHDLGYALSLYAVAGATTAGVFHLIWTMRSRKESANNSPLPMPGTRPASKQHPPSGLAGL